MASRDAKSSTIYVNVMLNFRVSMFWGFVAGLTRVMSLALYLGLSRPAGVAIVIFSFWGVFTNSDFRWDDALRRNRYSGSAFRALEHIFVSPGVHHSHHGYGKDGGNYRNFGICLSIFDWVSERCTFRTVGRSAMASGRDTAPDG